ncbi:MAG: hypothetical protein DRR06_19915 [Gammaproteobacteria bacterium]|nr:MAG: hypothetical protein DRR06_19915 [Gammaproteobacteria bacterium]
MAFVTFSGENKSMNITAGGAEINVEKDLYSGWKHWLSESDNAKFLQAFRTFGGDPTSAGQFAPKYFFLLNGWQVYVDGDITPNVDVALNLYVDGGGNPFVLSNEAVVSNLRSDVAVVESELQDTLDYAGQIVYDAIDGQSGSTHPTGTLAYPVNSSADLQSLMDLYDINRVLLQSNMVVTQDFNNVYFETNTAAEFLNPSGNKMDDCFFYRMSVVGDFDSGGTGSQVVIQDCNIGDVQGVYGAANTCHFGGTIVIQADQQFVFSDCASSVPGTGSPVLDMNPGEATGLSMRRYSGGLRVINCDNSGDTATIEYVAGKCHIGNSATDVGGCTDGYISVRGIALVNDWTNGTGTTVDTSALFETSNAYNGEVVYDTNDGVSGATYPVGTSFKPVNNVVDLRTIMTKYNIHVIKLESDIQLTQQFSATTFLPSGGIRYVDVNGQNVDQSSFTQLGIYGDFANSQTINIDCYAIALYRWHGIMNNCHLGGITQFSSVSSSTLSHCSVAIANSGPGNDHHTFDFSLGSQANIRAGSGEFYIVNMTQASDYCELDMVAGKVEPQASCTAGQVSIRGNSHVEDHSLGTTINDSNNWDAQVESAKLSETLGLGQSNFAMKDQTYTVSGSLETAIIKTYPTATDVTNDTNPLATYDVDATYDGNGLLTNYTVKKQ